MPEEPELLCGDWAWDSHLREMAHYPRKGKKRATEPDAVERLQPVRSVTWFRWSQVPMQSHVSGGAPMPASLSRVVIAYEAGGNLTINENDRECAGKIAETVAAAYDLPVVHEGAPTGRKAGNLPKRDEMGRLTASTGRSDVVLDEVAGTVQVARRKRLVGRDRRSYRTSDVRRVELMYGVNGSQETFEVIGVLGPEEERLAFAAYTGFEGWADPAEWREFTRELARALGVPATGAEEP